MAAKRILITGMSGTGKSTVLAELLRRGYEAVETERSEWSTLVRDDDGSEDWLLRVDAVVGLLGRPRERALFLAATTSNQGAIYPLLDEVVLLSAPADVILERVARRTSNPYGRTAEQRALILEHLATVEPLLRASATIEIDATAPLDAVVDRLEALATTSG